MEGMVCGDAGCRVETERLRFEQEGRASRQVLEERGLGGRNGGRSRGRQGLLVKVGVVSVVVPALKWRDYGYFFAQGGHDFFLPLYAGGFRRAWSCS